MRTPVLVVSGVDPAATDTAMVSLTWDLPRAVAVRHQIDPGSQVLTRTVSDATGILERAEITLDHACVTCALRADILPTLERLARDPRWKSIVVGLPTGTEAGPLAAVLSRDGRLARHLRLSSIVSTLGTNHLLHDLLSDALLRERGLHLSPGDTRGVGEVACAQIELADVVVLDGHPGPDALDLVRALARPDALVVTDATTLDAGALTQRRHQDSVTRAWAAPDIDLDLPPLGSSRAWRLDLSSPRPFHPERLLDQVERLGAGPRRSRGRFWVPTRPGALLEWSGAGGQISIGSHRSWGRRRPDTRMIVTGVGMTPTALVRAFEDALLSPAEGHRDERRWDVREDGLEPWLGDIRDIA